MYLQFYIIQLFNSSSLASLKVSNECDWFAISVILIGYSNSRPAKLCKRDNYMYVKQNCLWVLPINLLGRFKSIVLNIKVALWNL